MPVGESLTRAREARGLTVDDVSSATRIRAGLIRCIEREDYDACGGAVYARGHIRSIARVVGIDPEPLIEEFDRTHEDESTSVLGATPMVDAQAAAAAERRGPNWAAAMAVALVAICVLAAIGIATSNGGKGRPLADLPQPSATPTTPTPTPSAVAPTPPPNSVADAFDSKRATALVRIRSDQTSPSWISGQNFAGAGIYQATLQAGQQHQFRDPHGLCLVIGNVLAVQLVANGREVRIPRPASGSVVTHVTIARGKAPTFHSGPTSVCP